MPERWRVGVVERAVLEALALAGAYPDRPHRKNANIVGRMTDEYGVGPRYGYDTLCTLAKPWLVHILLVDFHGNKGSAYANDQPAAPRYTESRLSRAGALTLAAERGTGPKVPVALVNGNLSVDGTAPPYAPDRVVAAILAAGADPRITDAEIVDRVGPPASPTGCEVACDHVALARGESTDLVFSARLTVEAGPRGDQIVLTNLPLGASSASIGEALAARANVAARRSGDEFADLGLPLRGLQDDWYGDTARIVCEPQPGTDLEYLAEQIAATWGVTTRHGVRLAAPLPDLVRELVDDDPVAQRAALAMLLGDGRDPG